MQQVKAIDSGKSGAPGYLFNDWSGGGWNGNGAHADTPISGLTQLTSTFAENMNAIHGADAEAAYDIWLSGTSRPDEIMIWVDNANRGIAAGPGSAPVPSVARSGHCCSITAAN